MVQNPPDPSDNARMKATVIVPVLYSEPGLAQALGRLTSLGDRVDLEILVVVDVPDATREEEARKMNDAVAASPGVRVLYRVGERGFGSALRHAFGQAGGDVLIPFMGDESDRAEDIPRMIEKLETGYDVVAGSRYMKGGQTVGMTSKQQISHAYSLLVRAVGGLEIHDVSNAFKAFRRAVVDTVRTEAESFDISVELTIKAAQAGFRIGEIPTTWTNRAIGTSNFRFSREVLNYGRWLALAARGRFASGRRRPHVPIQGDGP
jgi:glycosyltransferase involved in cell wall biosynthesis